MEILIVSLWVIFCVFMLITTLIVVVVVGLELMTQALRRMAARLEETTVTVRNAASNLQESVRLRDELAKQGIHFGKVCNDR